MPGKDELPDTLRRSPAKAQRTWIKAHDSAVETYGEGERAHRTAFAALKHSFEKRRNRWTAKKQKGPSDPRSTKTTAEASAGRGETYGGVDVLGNSKPELYERAKQAGIKGRSTMSKEELARALSRKGG